MYRDVRCERFAGRTESRIFPLRFRRVIVIVDISATRIGVVSNLGYEDPKSSTPPGRPRREKGRGGRGRGRSLIVIQLVVDVGGDKVS
jgi:hypothetical protein